MQDEVLSPPAVAATAALAPANTIDWDAVQRDLHGLHLITAAGPRKQLSRDFYWYSPILTALLNDCIADLVVKVTNEDDVRQVAAVAAKHRLPLTVRAGGTGNYGQCVPLEGGLVMDVTQLCRVLEINDGRVRVEAGARLHHIEQTVNETGQALRMWPSTWHVASIGGYIAGGFGGIGSIRHGILRDTGNMLRARVMTVESEPQIIELQGDEIQQVQHAFGTNGILLDVEMALSPSVEWIHVTALFDTYPGALDFCSATDRPELDLFLLSSVEARFSPYYTAMGELFPADRHAVFSMVSPDTMPAFRDLVEAHGGRISLAGTEAELQAAGRPPAYECAFNHTTLQALKADRSWTYMQVSYAQPFDKAVVARHMAIFGDDVLQHHDFVRAGGTYATFSILLVRWKDEAHMNSLMREIESEGGCLIFNPHVVTIEDGGMKTIDTQQIDFKKRSDPMGLMNPGKTRGWRPEMARLR